MPLKRKAGQKQGAAWSDDKTRLREQSTCFSFMENFGVHEYTCIVNPSRPPYIDVSENVLVITNTLHDK
jgi:hypothetical protein